MSNICQYLIIIYSRYYKRFSDKWLIFLAFKVFTHTNFFFVDSSEDISKFSVIYVIIPFLMYLSPFKNAYGKYFHLF